VPTTRNRLWLVAVLAVAVAIAIGVTLALSGRDGEPARAAATGATTAAPTTAAPAPTTAAPAAAPTCAPATILPVLQATLDKDSGSGGGPKLTGVTVERCAHGFANVTATPARADTDVLLAFLKADGGNWQVIDYGSDVGCTSDAAPGVIAACRGLGYPVTD
jgi:hypothetical protein